MDDKWAQTRSRNTRSHENIQPSRRSPSVQDLGNSPILAPRKRREASARRLWVAEVLAAPRGEDI